MKTNNIAAALLIAGAALVAPAPHGKEVRPTVPHPFPNNRAGRRALAKTSKAHA